jgi:dihydrolipoamide dehydrogenase
MVVGEFTQESDLVVIGGGPGGYSAAFRARALGIEVTLVDIRDHLGGTSVHAGAVPMSTLRRIAAILRSVTEVRAMGVEFDPPRICTKTIARNVEELIRTEAEIVDRRCEELGVQRVTGRASFEDSRTLHVTGSDVQRLRFRRAVIATGAQDIQLPSAIESPHVVYAADAMPLDTAIGRMLVIGGGPTALELAGVYAALGAAVTLVDSHQRLLRSVDEDLLAPLLARLRASLRGIHPGTTVTAMTSREHQIDAVFSGDNPPDERRYDRVIIAIGRRAATDDLGLERTAVRLAENGSIPVDEQGRSADPRIFAVGDVIGETMTTTAAAERGRVCAEAIAGWATTFEPRAVPNVFYTDPQIAWCGLTERDAAREGYDAAVATADAGEGKTKLVYDRDTKLILGVGAVGSAAAEMIGEGALAIEMGAVLTDLAQTLHAHPTLGASIQSSARAAEASES